MCALTAKKIKKFFFFFNDTAPTEIYTLSLHDALPIWPRPPRPRSPPRRRPASPQAPRPHPPASPRPRSEEHTSELQSPDHLVCRLLLEKKKRRSSAPCASLPPHDHLP